MAKDVGKINRFSGGISDGIKEDLVPNTCAFSQSISYRNDPRQISLLPKPVWESGSVIKDLPQWAERVGDSGDTYIYDRSGRIYKRTSSGTYTLEHTVPGSTGNGLAFFGEDKYLYATSDTTITRFGQVGISTNWYDNFLGSEGGVPTNTHSLLLASASSQYASRASTASLQITGSITLEAYVKMTSLPAVGGRMTLLGKWDESGATRSYTMDIKGISNFFLDGSDGALTISADTTDAPIDSACSGTVDTYSLTATNASFAAGQAIMIHQSMGTSAGNVQYTTIQSYTAGTITTTDKLNYSYSSSGSNKAQVLVMKRYTTVTVNIGKTWTAKAWNGTVGGILAFYANGAVTVNGVISAIGKGFRGGAGGVLWNNSGNQGEGTSGTGTVSDLANGNGAGGGVKSTNGHGFDGGSGGSGGNGLAGGVGNGGDGASGGAAGGTSGNVALTNLTFGGGGGGGASISQYGHDRGYTGTGADGGAGGGIIAIFASSLDCTTGSVNATGGAGSGGTDFGGGAGGGAGGSILIKSQTAVLGTDRIIAAGGAAQNVQTTAQVGGVGRIHLDYSTSFTGTTNPSLDSTLDTSLNASDGHQLRLGISSTGSNEEFLTQTITGEIDTSSWTRWSISWTAGTSTANFYRNGVLLGTKTGTLTAISSNASAFYVGANKGASAVENFLNANIDDVRVFSAALTESTIVLRNDSVLTGIETGLVAYYKFDNAYTDTTANTNDLTSSGSPTFDLNDVPFSGVTTRTDQDQSLTATGQTYTLLTAISEGAQDRQTFVPTKDPQKSIRVYIDTVGTGTWTLTVHDALNRVVASSSVAAASLTTGFNEFFMSSVWRPIVGATYHFHLTVSTGTSKVRTSGAGDMETADFATFYQFLVTDSWHPMKQIVNVLAIANERYLATYNGVTYNNQRLTFPSGTRVRALAYWREYLAIGTWKGSSVTDYDEGKIFFWDGISDTYNFFIDVPEGGINALFGSKGKLFAVAGYLGDILLYQGGVEAQKIKRLPKVTLDSYIEIFPGAMTMWQTLLDIGVAGSGDSETVNKGVYTWGSLNRNYADSLNFDFPVSVGSVGSSIQVGMVASIGQKLLVGWRNGLSYGIDMVDPTGDCVDTGSYEGLIEDMNKMEKTKLPLLLRADFEPLISGQSITVKFKVDREANWRTFTVSDVGAANARFRISNRVREIQPGLDLNTSTGVSPIVYNFALEDDNLSTERDI